MDFVSFASLSPRKLIHSITPPLPRKPACAGLCSESSGSLQELCRLQIRFIVVCVTLLISKKSTNFTLLPLCCLLAISCLLHCSVFKVQVSDPSSRSDRNARSLDQTLRFDLVVEVTGLEPVTPACKAGVLPAELNPRTAFLLESGGPKWTRTTDLTIISRAL